MRPRASWRWVSLVLLVGIACRAPAQIAADPLDKLEAGTPTEQVHVFLISPGDAGRSGRRVGCGDSAVPATVQLPRPAPALEGAVRALLAMHERHDPRSGLENALYSSELELAGIDRQGPEARLRLTGYVELDDSCENARLLAQLTETALQFSDLSHVQILVEGQPLRDLILASQSPPTPPPADSPAEVPAATPPPPATALSERGVSSSPWPRAQLPAAPARRHGSRS